MITGKIELGMKVNEMESEELDNDIDESPGKLINGSALAVLPGSILLKNKVSMNANDNEGTHPAPSAATVQ
jgi:hypothetical protein